MRTARIGRRIETGRIDRTRTERHACRFVFGRTAEEQIIVGIDHIIAIGKLLVATFNFASIGGHLTKLSKTIF